MVMPRHQSRDSRHPSAAPNQNSTRPNPPDLSQLPSLWIKAKSLNISEHAYGIPLHWLDRSHRELRLLTTIEFRPSKHREYKVPSIPYCQSARSIGSTYSVVYYILYLQVRLSASPLVASLAKAFYVTSRTPPLMLPEVCLFRQD